MLPPIRWHRFPAYAPDRFSCDWLALVLDEGNREPLTRSWGGERFEFQGSERDLTSLAWQSRCFYDARLGHGRGSWRAVLPQATSCRLIPDGRGRA